MSTNGKLKSNSANEADLLRGSQYNQFQLMFEHHHAVMLLIEPVSGAIIAANLAAEKFYGYQPNQLCSMNIEQINCLSQEQVAIERNRAAKEQKNYFFFEHRRANGEIRSVEVHSSPIDVNGRILLFSIVHDVTNRKQTEEALNKIVRAVEQSSVAIELFDLQGRIEYVNPKNCELTGYSLLENLGQTSSIFKSDLQTELQQQTLQEIFRAGKEWTGELTNRRKNGERYWEAVSISPILDEQNAISHYIAIREDISEQKITESTYRFLAQRSWIPGKVDFFSALAVYILETTGLSDIWFCKVNSTPLSAETFTVLHNGVFQQNFSFPIVGGPWENIGSSLITSIPDNVHTLFPEATILLPLQIEWFLGVPLWGSNGELIGFIALLNHKSTQNQHIAEGVLKIVSSRAAAELERFDMETVLRSSEQRYRDIVEHAVEGIFQSTPSGHFISVNPAMASLYGYTSPEDMLDSVKIIRHQIYAHSDQRAEFMRLLRQNKFVMEFEAENLRKDGSIFWISCNARIVHDETGSPLYYEGTVIDITARKQAEIEASLNQRRLNALLDFSQRNFGSQQELLEFALKMILEVTYSESGFIYWFDPATKQFILRVSMLSENIQKPPKELVQDDNMLLSEIFKLNHPILTKRFHVLQGDDRNVVDYFLHIDNLVVVPLMEKVNPKAIIGAIRHERGFSEQELKQFGLVADSINQIIEYKEAQEQIQNSLREKEALLHELYHRTKNNMQVISAMLSLQGAQSGQPEIRKSFKEMESRIHAMSLVHQKLYQAKNLSRIDLDEYLQELTKQLMEGYDYQVGTISLKFDLQKVAVLIDTALPLGLITNELLTNVLKFAFPDARNGEISIRLSQQDNGLIELSFADNGVGFSENFDPFKDAKIGLQTVIAICNLQLHGSIEFLNRNGVTCLIRFSDTYYKERV